VKPTLAGIPQFVRYLSAFPPASRVVEAALRGPLSHVGGRTLFLWQVRDGDILTAVGAYGHTAEEIGRYAQVPLSLDGLSARAVHSHATVVKDLSSADLSLLSRLDDAMLQGLISRTGARYGVNVPVIHAGDVVGAYGVSVDQTWDATAIAPLILDAVASALATWMTHPRSEVSRVEITGPHDWSLAFTARQKEALRLVDAGMSTPSIATTLGVSESSVKADLQQAMRALRTSERREAARRARSLGLL
jgi:DNA-binding CsgD family transcriptional regulator